MYFALLWFLIFISCVLLELYFPFYEESFRQLSIACAIVSLIGVFQTSISFQVVSFFLIYFLLLSLHFAIRKRIQPKTRRCDVLILDEIRPYGFGTVYRKGSILGFHNTTNRILYPGEVVCAEMKSIGKWKGEFK